MSLKEIENIKLLVRRRKIQDENKIREKIAKTLAKFNLKKFVKIDIHNSDVDVIL